MWKMFIKLLLLGYENIFALTFLNQNLFTHSYGMDLKIFQQAYIEDNISIKETQSLSLF